VPEEEAFDALPNEKVRELVERAAMSDQQKAAEAKSGIDLAAFLQVHSEFDALNGDTCLAHVRFNVRVSRVVPLPAGLIVPAGECKSAR